MDPVRQLYEQLLQQGLYTKSFEEFQGQFATAGAQQQLYDNLNNQNLYTKSLEEFQNQFFAPRQVQVDPAKEAFMTDALQTMTQQQADKAWEMTQSKPKRNSSFKAISEMLLTAWVGSVTSSTTCTGI